MADDSKTVVVAGDGAGLDSAGFAGDGSGYASDTREPGAGQILLWLHIMLRGRYIWLAVLAIIFGSAMGYGGYKLGYKTFRSTGLIQLVRPLKVTLNDVQDDAADAEGFLSTQAALIRSQRVIDMAMATPEWQALRRPVSDTASEEFAQALTVLPRERMIYVSFEDRDARVAGIALKAVIGVYRGMYVEDDANKKAHRLMVLQQQEIALGNEESGLRARIDAIASKYGTSDLGTIYMSKRGTAERLGELLQEINMRLALAPSTTQPAAQTQELAAFLEKLEVEELAQKDGTLRELLVERSRTEREMRRMATVNGYGDSHPKMEEARKALEAVEQDVAARARRVRDSLKRVQPTATANLDRAELTEKQKLISEWYAKANDEMKAIGQEGLQIKNLQEDREAVRAKLEPLRKWLGDLNLQSAEGSRIQIISDGTTPSTPQTDTRVRFAAMGGMLGIVLAFGIVVLPAAANRRFRAADETKVGSYMGPVLGVLPELPGNLSDDENAAMAAHCVHQTRTLLQMRHEGSQGQVLAITSSVAGTGKTSLALALGVSFATSGSRTLMIDCDLVGGGLSHRVSRITRRKIGHLLRREGLLTDEQLERALGHALRTNRPLGQVCVELGFVGERDVQRLLDVQDGSHMGVLEGLAGEALEDCVAQTGFPGLSILPLGAASARHCASISPAALRRLLKAARGSFDTVLIDTGPVPGSLEASVVVPQADGVVLVVSKGEHRPSVTRTVDHLRSLNAMPVGVVFNRASIKEVSNNSSTMHRSTAAFGSSSGMGLKIDPEQSRRSNRLGPMAQAVAGCAPHHEAEEDQQA